MFLLHWVSSWSAQGLGCSVWWCCRPQFISLLSSLTCWLTARWVTSTFKIRLFVAICLSRGLSNYQIRCDFHDWNKERAHVDWSSRKPQGPESRWCQGWAPGQNSFSQCVKSLEIPDEESHWKPGDIFQSGGEDIGPYSWGVTIHHFVIHTIILLPIFSSLGKGFLYWVIALKGFHSDSCPWSCHFMIFTIFWPRLWKPHYIYILILFSFFNTENDLKIFSFKYYTLSIS